MGLKPSSTFDIEKLLKPYREGGSRKQPVERTIGTISSKLIIANRIPPEIVGAAIFKVFHAMAYKGLEFEGTEKYGSKGKELFSCIKAQAIDMVQKKSKETVIAKIGLMTACTITDCSKRSRKLVPKTRWQRIKRSMSRSRDLLWFIKWTV